MLLLKLELQNFRGFYGNHVVNFASDGAKRVTIFYGENGAGKTNLLNAIHWCITGKFTPRFQDSTLLVNKQAFSEGERECHVELTFRDEMVGEGKLYRVRRASTNERQTGLDVFQLEKGNSMPIAKGDSLLRRILPPGLVSWFFFDAEAIGSLELSGSAAFKQDLRKTLGFELVDTLLKDLEIVRSRRQREVAVQTNDKALREIQDAIDRIDHIMPGQREKQVDAERELDGLKRSYDAVRKALAGLPKSKPLEERRTVLEREIRSLIEAKKAAELKAAQMIGAAAAATFIHDQTVVLEGTLQQQEVKGKLPSPYSDQLVKDILDAEACICGRPVPPGTEYETKIRDLMKFASTGELNQRIGRLRYLIRDIELATTQFPLEITATRTHIAEIDLEIARREEERDLIGQQLSSINISEISKLEGEREELEDRKAKKERDLGGLELLIHNNERRRNELQLQYDSTAKKLAVNQKFKKELEKTTRLISFIEKTLLDQEIQALNILSIELNAILERYLTKHYKAKIDPKTYAVNLLDASGNRVGHSTGEGQVLKFAFIATVVALAAKKTQQKISWLAEPTVAPLVLDAPFSALDPEYQGSVAKNLAAQATQLVLMISSAAWGERVADALEPLVGQRYLIVSKEPGKQGEKPIKRIALRGQQFDLNAYDASRSESIFVEVA